MGTLSRKWIFWTTYGVFQPWGPTHGIQVPLTSWRLLDLTGGLLEAWIPLMRITWILACSQGRVTRADWRLLLWLPGFVRPLSCILQLESSENSSPLYSMLMFHTEARLPPLEREFGHRMQRRPESRRVSMQGRDNHCWSLPKQLTKSSFNIWLRLDCSVPMHIESPWEAHVPRGSSTQPAERCNQLWGTKETQARNSFGGGQAKPKSLSEEGPPQHAPQEKTKSHIKCCSPLGQECQPWDWGEFPLKRHGSDHPSELLLQKLWI